ncbi:MAG: autotransporter domain-containing protein [Alphaproteobacteria bacterium]|nr:autotransporter domain-containing protein [Alphaproteobacteria bacterium]
MCKKKANSPFVLLLAAAVVYSLVSSTAFAADFTVQSGQTVNAPQTLNTPGDTGTIEAGGTINTAGDAVSATGGVDGVTVNNDGTVISTNQDAVDVNNGNTINNSGLLQSGNGGGDEGIEGGSNNTITNSGTIRSANDDAIDVLNNNVLNNSGTIQGGNGGGDNGFEAGNGNTISNTGSITSGGGDAINVQNNNSIGNSGLIQGGNGNNDEAISAGSNNTITNSGTIRSANDDAIDVLDNNVFNNSGTIQGGNGGGDRGIEGRDGNSITNTGSITSGGDDGINVRDNNSIVNSGLVRSGNGADQGIVVRDNNTIFNAGTIISQSSDAVRGRNNVSINNSGLIQGGATANQQGVDINANGTLVNTGQILGGEAVEMGVNGTLINSGTIQSLLGPGGTAIDFVGNGNDTLALSGAFNIVGAINFRGGTDTISYGPGISSALTFGIGGLPENIVTSGQPFAVLGNQIAVLDPTALAQTDEMLADLTSGIFNSVHARLRLARSHGGSGAQFGGIGLGAMGLGARNISAPMHLMPEDFSNSASSGHSNVWAQAFGGHRDDDANGTSLASTHSYIGGIVGMDGWLTRGVRIGGFAGGAQADLETAFDSQELDIESFFGGLYTSLSHGNWFANVIVTAGQSDYDSTRRVANNLVAGGIQLGTASFDGTFISPEVTVGTTINLGWLSIEPSARLRYAHLSLDGYTETGALGNLAIADRDVSLWLGRAQVAFPFTSAVGTLSPRVGIEAWSSDHDTISAILLGQTLSFNPGGQDDEVTGFVGATASTNLGGGASAFVDGEIHVDDDGFSRAEAHAGFKIQF